MEKKIQRILAEFQKRQKNKPNFLDSAFEQQKKFINSKALRKVAICTRRAGKSYLAGLYAFKTAFENPGCNVSLIGLTRDSIRKIYAKDILAVINNTYKLNAQFNKSDLSVTLPNKSIIYLVGVDDTPEQANKLLGQKLKLVVIDESAFYSINIRHLVEEIIEPALADQRGTLVLISTPSNITHGLYYDITTGSEPGWEVHKWTGYDNPHVTVQWGEQIARMKANNPEVENLPMFRRMYKGEWAIAESGLVYKYAKIRNAGEQTNNKSWRYVLSIDLGYEDASAFVVSSYSKHSDVLYVVHAEKKKEMIVSDVAEKIKQIAKLYEIETMVIDGASKQVVQELIKRFNLPLIIAKKDDKKGHIELVNNDLLLGKIKITNNAKELATEMESLVWNEKKLEKGIYEEQSSCENHLCDAFLYNFNHLYHYSAKPVTEINNKEQDKVDKFWERQEKNYAESEEIEWN